MGSGELSPDARGVARLSDWRCAGPPSKLPRFMGPFHSEAAASPEEKSIMKPTIREPFRKSTLALVFPALLAARLHASSETWDGEAATNLLNTATNWTNNALPANATDTATWNGTVTGALALVWNGNFGPSGGNAGGVNISLADTQADSVQLDATAGTFGLGDVSIATGAGALTLGNGAGTSAMTMRDPSMTFTNNSSNPATVQSDVVFGNGGGIGTRNVTVDGTGNWIFNTALFPSAFSNVASALLVKNGSGTLALNASNSYGGTTALNLGIIDANASSALGTGGAVNVPNGGGRLRLSGGIALANSFNLPGRTNVTSSSPELSNIENLSGNNSISGNLTWNSTGGTFNNILSTADTLTLSGNLSTTLTTGPRTFYFTGAGNFLVSGNITDGASTALGVAKGGAGTLTLSGSNSYTLGTSVLAGTLALGSANAIGSTGPILFGGGSLQYSSSNTTDYSARIAAGTSSGAVTIDTNGQAISFTTPLTADQSGGLVKRGAGTLTLTTANSHGGTSTVSGGTLEVTASGALSSGTVAVPNGSGKLLLSNNIALPNALTVSGATNDASNSFNFAKIQNLSGDNSIAGSITWNETGGLFTNFHASAGTLTLSGNLSTAVITGTRTFNFAGPGNFLVSGAIADGSATAAVSKVGGGLLTLSGTNTYTGATSILSGTLALGSTGSIDNSSALAIYEGATLDATAKAGFTVPAALSIGLDGNAATSGLIDSSGQALDIDGAALSFSTTGTLNAPAYVLANYGTLSGTPSFAAVTLPPGYELDYTYLDGPQIALVQKAGYDTWITSFFGSESNPAVIGKDADPDGDGAGNLFEFALNGDPTSGANNGLIASLLQDTSAPSGDELTLLVAVRNGAIFGSSGNPVSQSATTDGMVYSIEGSLDLTNLPGSAVSHVSGPAAAAPSAAALPDLTGSGWAYHTFKLDASDGLSGKGFLRVKVEAAP